MEEKMRVHSTLGYVALVLLALGTCLPTGAQTYTYSTLYSFQNNGKDPANPPFLVPAFLILGSDGNLYGTSSEGGIYGAGTVFKVTLQGQLRVLHNFKPTTNLDAPNSLARQAKVGNLFGTTTTDVFKLTPGKNGSHTFSTLYSNSAADITSGTLDGAGNFYGTDEKCNPNACVFEIPASSGTWTDIYDLGSQANYSLLGNIIISKARNLYVSASFRGTVSDGWVQEIGGSFSTFSPPSTFPDSLRQDAAGNIYGLATSDSSATGTYGNVFKIDTNGVVSTLYSFTDGSQPLGSFSVDSTGNVFGTAVATDESGFVFKVTPSGQESVLQTFSSSMFNIGVVMDKAGNLYGVTSGSGGTGGQGSVYTLTLVP
jgi:uncharacterized repeat protein (TIGR03803 family)